MCLFRVPKCHQFGWKFPFLHGGSKVIVTEKGISTSGNWIFYSKTGGEFNCSVANLDIWQIHIFSLEKRKKCFFLPQFYFRWKKSDKTLARSILTLLVMQIEDRLKNVAENIKPSLFTHIYTDVHRYIHIFFCYI